MATIIPDVTSETDETKAKASPPQQTICAYVPHGTVPDIRGFSPALVAWNQSLRLQRFSAFIACPAEAHPAGMHHIRGVPVFRYARRRLEERWHKIAGGSWTPLLSDLVTLCRNKTPDILHAHQLEFPVSLFRRRHKRYLPIIAHAHVPNQRFNERRGIADHYIAVSEHVRSIMISQGYPGERVSVVRNGVDTGLFQPLGEARKSEVRTRLGLPQQGSILAFFGRKQTEKGFDVFLGVARTLLLEDPRLVVLSIGPETAAMTDPDYQAHLALRKDLTLTGRFYDWPPLPQAALGQVLGIVDVTLLPSKEEPQGMAMIESLAAGCVTISTSVGGIRESISDGVTGFLLDNPSNMGEALARTRDSLANLDHLVSLREEARKSACALFDWTHSARHLEAIYARVLGSSLGSRGRQ